jgi:type IV secretion system protein TrbI
MSEATPTGLELKPKAPNVERLSKRAGLLMVVILAVLFGLIIFGIMTRQPVQNTGIQEAPKAATAATLAGREIVNEVPDGNVGRLTPPTTPANARDALLPASQTAAPVTYGTSQQTPQGPTPEERRLSEAYALEQEARRASTGANAGGGSMRGIDSLLGGNNNSNPLDGLLRSLGGANGAAPPGLDAALRNLTAGGGADPAALARLGAGGATPNEFAAQNNQQFKSDFVKASTASNQAAYLKSLRTAQISPYEVKAGWDIPASMEQGINSDLPGELKALITQNVYDTATGRHLLIPQGTRALGIYSSNISYGQDGVQVVWQRLIFPDGSSIDLGSMVGQDASGYAGFRDQVNNHWARLIGGALLSSVFTAGFQISQGGQSNALGVQSNSQIAASAAGQEVSRVGSEITRRNLNIQPTIEIRPGYRFNIRVNRDMLFEAPYQPMRASR